MLAKSVALLSTYWPATLLAALLIYLLRNKFYNGLNQYPGPLLAAYTNWWRFFENWLGRSTEQTHIALHRKYGDIVRIGPNVLSFADPKAIKVIYGTGRRDKILRVEAECSVGQVLTCGLWSKV